MPVPLQQSASLSSMSQYDCVDPLPKTKAGHQFVLIMMCEATHFPEAVPLHTLKARAVVRALVKLFSTFGLPKRIQTDARSPARTTR